MKTLILFVAMFVSSITMATEHPNIVRLWAPGLIVQKADDSACYFSEDIYSSNGAIWIEDPSSVFLTALFKGKSYDTLDPTIKRGQPISSSDLNNEQLKQMALSGYKIYSVCETGLKPYSYTIESGDLPDGERNKPYSFSLATMVKWSGGYEGAVKRSLFWYPLNALPAGLQLDDGGVISGTPTEVGARSFEVVAASNSITANQTFTITVNGVTLIAKSFPTGRGQHTCVITVENKVACWGDNSMGELGNGTTNSSSTPVYVEGLPKMASVSVSHYHTCASSIGGEVYCWGNHTSGQLGTGSPSVSNPLIPNKVYGISNAASVFIDANHSCALLNGGQIKCWGQNWYGELGNGNRNDTSIPTYVVNITNAIKMDIADQHACALLSDGSVSCWGGNYQKQAGQNSPEIITTPTKVAGISNAGNIALTTYTSCALGNDGSVKCWGNNYQGTLGIGIKDDSFQTSTPVTTISSGASKLQSHSSGFCAYTSGYYCWGYNLERNTAIGSSYYHYSPAPLSRYNDTKEIYLGVGYVCGMEYSGRVRCSVGLGESTYID